MSKHKKKRKTIMQKTKAYVREVRTEATIQAVQASSIGQLWKNYINSINKAVDDFKQARREKKAKEKQNDRKTEENKT